MQILVARDISPAGLGYHLHLQIRGAYKKVAAVMQALTSRQLELALQS